MARNVTIEDVARAAGVSKGTVSLALRGIPRIPELTRRHVRKVADDLGYRPNALVAAHMATLRQQRETRFRATLAYLREYPENPTDSMSKRLGDGVRRRAESLGYKIEDVYLSDKLSARRRTQILLSRGIVGVIYRPPVQAPAAPVLDWKHFALALMGHTWPDASLHRSTHYNYKVVTDLLRELDLRGYRRIGLALLAESDTRGNHFALAGFLVEQFIDSRRKVIKPLVTADWREAVFRDWIAREKPDAIITSEGDTISKWVGRYKRHIGVATTCWHAEDAFVAGIELDCYTVGATAVDLVVGQLHRGESGLPESPKMNLIQGRWRDGESVRSLANTKRKVKV